MLSPVKGRTLLFLAFSAAACSLDESGLLAGDASGDAPIDAALDAPADAPEEPFVCADAGAASCADAAPYRMPALFSPDAAAPCPAGYDTHDLLLAAPNAPNCGCNCADAGTPSCGATAIDYHYGFGFGGCAAGSGTIALGGTCTAVTEPTYTGENVEIDTPAITGGCTGGTSVAPPATSTNARLCVPECASDETVCSAQGALHACVYVAGNVPSCPSDYASGPFYVGATPQVTCDGCSCVATGDCTGSTAHLYGDTTCGSGDLPFPMDGQCHALSGSGATWQSANVKPSLAGYQCKVTPGASHLTYVGESFTVCCK